MSAITWSLIDERSDIFDGWGVVRGRLFKLGDRDMSELKNIKIELPEQSNEEIFTNWFVAEFGSPKVVFISKFGNAEYKRIRAAWNVQQEKILSLKAQLNDMERCYIEMKKERDALQSTKLETKWTTIKVKCLKCGHYLSGCHCNHFGDQCPHLNTSIFSNKGLAECFNCNAVINENREVVGIVNE